MYESMTWAGKITSMFSTVMTPFIFALYIFSAFMIYDCIKRDIDAFPPIFMKEEKYEKIIWIATILLTAKLFAAGAFAYNLLIRSRSIKDDA